MVAWSEEDGRLKEHEGQIDELRRRVASLLGEFRGRIDPALLVENIPGTEMKLVLDVLDDEFHFIVGIAGVAGETRLTRREGEILALLRAGEGNKGIAHELGCSEHTVHAHLKILFVRFGVASRTALVQKTALIALPPVDRAGPRTQNPEPRTQNPEPRTQTPPKATLPPERSPDR